MWRVSWNSSTINVLSVMLFIMGITDRSWAVAGVCVWPVEAS